MDINDNVGIVSTIQSKRCNKLKTIDAKYYNESNNVDDRKNKQQVQSVCVHERNFIEIVLLRKCQRNK